MRAERKQEYWLDGKGDLRERGRWRWVRIALAGAAVFLLLGYLAYLRVDAYDRSYHLSFYATSGLPHEAVVREVEDLRNWEHWAPWLVEGDTPVFTYHEAEGETGPRVVWRGQRSRGTFSLGRPDRQRERYTVEGVADFALVSGEGESRGRWQVALEVREHVDGQVLAFTIEGEGPDGYGGGYLAQREFPNRVEQMVLAGLDQLQARLNRPAPRLVPRARDAIGEIASVPDP